MLKSQKPTSMVHRSSWFQEIAWLSGHRSRMITQKMHLCEGPLRLLHSSRSVMGLLRLSALKGANPHALHFAADCCRLLRCSCLILFRSTWIPIGYLDPQGLFDQMCRHPLTVIQLSRPCSLFDPNCQALDQN